MVAGSPQSRATAQQAVHDIARCAEGSAHRLFPARAARGIGCPAAKRTHPHRALFAPFQKFRVAPDLLHRPLIALLFGGNRLLHPVIAGRPLLLLFGLPLPCRLQLALFFCL